MEKTTKKRKKSKRLKKRIGLVVIGGLSLVLTVCLSVGATLAWFAGSTWASNDMYMGGPVYVEMAGRGHAETSGALPDNAEKNAVWQGGAGTLDIVASQRSTGTVGGGDNILLPGQKLLIYSQARVFSTLATTTINNGQYPDNSSGSDNSNVSDGTAWYYDGTGRAQTATTSVLRAKFSINIEFDPSVGFNNFTDAAYVAGYPVQSTDYKGDYGTYETYSVADGTGAITGVGSFAVAADDEPGVDDEGYTVTTGESPNVVTTKYLFWEGALQEPVDGEDYVTPSEYKVVRTRTNTGTTEAPVYVVTTNTYGRRDAVPNPELTNFTDKTTGLTEGQPGYDAGNATALHTEWVRGDNAQERWQIKLGESKSIYKWKYVSKTQYDAAKTAGHHMGYPFDGTVNTLGNPSEAGGGSGNGYYGVWEVDAAGNKLESDAFYKARTENYLQSYVEHYLDDYNRDLVLQIGESLNALENKLNESFVKLVNESSDKIIDGLVDGFTADEDGKVTDDAAITWTGTDRPSWLYVDPKVGNDTNAGDSSTSVGGWWYLVSSSGDDVKTNANQVNTVVDVVSGATKQQGNTDPDTATTLGTDGRVVYKFNDTDLTSKNNPQAANTAYKDSTDTPSKTNAAKVSDTFVRYNDKATLASQEAGIANGSIVKSDDVRILNAKLFEIKPNISDRLMSTNPVDGTKTTKVVSVAFPFVNGNFELPGKELTNVFANAKISFQITFQALQAFFPFADSIDGCGTGTALAGTGKALNIGNAIPIYNEAFDYLSYRDTADFRGNGN